MNFDVVIVGGGIGAVSCVEEIIAISGNELSIAVITASPFVKSVSNLAKLGYSMEIFDVEEKRATSVFERDKNVTTVQATVVRLDSDSQRVLCSNGDWIHYKRLCIATGGKPKILKESPFVIGIRDTETVKNFLKKLCKARRIAIVGNGGIATELLFEVQNVEVIWVVKHHSISATFVDAGAAEFFLPHLNDVKPAESVSKRTKYTATDQAAATSSTAEGVALGPDWLNDLSCKGELQGIRKVHVELDAEVSDIRTAEEMVNRSNNVTTVDGFTEKDWPVFIQLTNGKQFGCDLIVSATGVEPNTSLWNESANFKVAADGGLAVDDQMRTNVEGIFACGDVCSAAWPSHPHWLQMRLWTQAKQMGTFTGRCIVASLKGETAEMPICFEIFTHVTNFFGFKVILLGKFNGQGLGPGVEALVRVTKGQEYVKVLVENDRVQGAVLIGETDLEETLENLILNQTDIGAIKDDLLNPSVDIEDYFD